MKRNLPFLVFALWTMWSGGCGFTDKPSTPWIPVLEQTDFNYLEIKIPKVLWTFSFIQVSKMYKEEKA
ncbi:MAG: hypothetical protein JRK53_10360 [Deltaproteobacteria bacterium]|nr:hypothetical protein [Deltaproteobacteria bacterium]